MLAVQNSADSLSEVNFKEKVRCGEVYRNLNGNEMFQKFYYRCLECSMDFESSPEFEEHVIVHYLQDDEAEPADNVNSLKTTENVISISSDEDEEENDYLYAFEVASLVEENVSENDLPLPLMQMLSEHSADSCDKTVQLNSGTDEDVEDSEENAVFQCEGLRKQALHVFSEHCCTQCPAYFSTKSELIFHLHVHTLPSTVVCPHCYEAFPNTFKLNEHLGPVRRKRVRKTKHKECEMSPEKSQNCKKLKNDMRKDGEHLHDEEKKNDANHFTNDETRVTNSESSSIVGMENGSKQNLIINETDKLKTSNNIELCPDVMISNHYHISNDT